MRYSHFVHDSTLDAMWREHFSGKPTLFASAPGRVNLIGEHTDYNEGFVFPAAIDRRTNALLRTTAGSFRVLSNQAGPSAQFFPGETVKGRNWARYAAACAKRLQDHTGETPPALEGVLNSHIPSGSGLSSSAALDLCFLTAWNELCRYGFTPKQLALMAAEADNLYVGVQSGIMDQMASALGEEGKALFIDTRSQEYWAHSLPPGIDIAILDTRKPRALAASAYNDRVRECKQAVDAIVLHDPAVKSLRDVTLDQVESAEMNEVVRKRARHVVSENARAIAFRDALESSNLPALGRLARESHESLRNDYEVSCRELDAMARAAWNAPGCVAARMTGAGFGGCCVALVVSDLYLEFEASVRASYGMYGYREPALFRTSAAQGGLAIILGNHSQELSSE
ncbi:MAG: galactokinase [Fimbriimonadales bacterium]|nr:galactokinase [Fimbriimonadales bacterium]